MKSPSQLAVGLVLVGTLMLFVPSPVKAQLSESEMTEYIPETSFLFISINMESILKQTDLDHALIKKFAERKTASNADFTNWSQLLVAFASNDEGSPEPFDIPALTITRFADAVERETIQEKMQLDSFGNFTFEQSEYGDQEIFLGKYEAGAGVMMGAIPGYFFPVENILVNGPPWMLESVIDNQDQDSDGKELAGNLDSDADIHLLLNKGSNITALAMFEFMEEGIPVQGLREILDSIETAEIVGDMDEMIPLTGTIKLDSEDAAKRLEELIRTGLQAVPGLVMLAEGEIDASVERDNGEIADIEKEARQMLELAKTVSKELEITRNDSTLELQLANVDGLDKLAHSAMVMAALQGIEMEKFREEMGEIEAIPLEQAAPLEEAKKRDDGQH